VGWVSAFLLDAPDAAEEQGVYGEVGGGGKKACEIVRGEELPAS